jgi:hypothetical protein
MRESIRTDRRSFLRTSAAGAAGLMAGGVLPQAVSASGGGVWVDGMQINPNIDNLRVAYCEDPDMSGPSTMHNHYAINGAVNNELLWENMDKLAMTLAGKSTPAEAWATIFQKPEGKDWPDVKVVIKGIMERIAVDAKICFVLHDLGVPYSNIYLLDGWCWPKDVRDAPFMPEGLIYAGGGGNDDFLGMGGYVTVPVVVDGQTINVPCAADIANGLIDIIVNIPSNRGHNITAGGATLCMKTHYGTFNAAPVINTPFHLDPMIAPIVAFNKHDAIIGGSPPRQQLCIIDNLWAMSGFSSGWDFQHNELLMGTFAPAVDFLCITKIRTAKMGCGAVPLRYLNRILQDFGYTQEQQDALDWVPIGTPTASTAPPRGITRKSRFRIAVSCPAFKRTSLELDLPFEGPLRLTTTMHDQRGRLVREITTNRKNDAMTLAWDGRSSSGMMVAPGTYAIRVSCGGTSSTGSLTLVPR